LGGEAVRPPTILSENEAGGKHQSDAIRASNGYRIMKLKELMTKEVETIAPDIPIQEAADRMRSLDVGVLPVSRETDL
jgi:CBS domain-containing protein